MSTAQDPPVRNKQKRRRTKQLAQWRAKQPAKEPVAQENSAKSAKRAPAAKAAGKPAK